MQNYSNKEQQEIQRAYLGHEIFSIFIAWCYFRGNDGKLKIRDVTVTFDALDPSRIAAHIKVLVEVTKEMPGIFKAYLCSNGCDANFCLRFGI